MKNISKTCLASILTVLFGVASAPLVAQAPGDDDGNHKDKPEVKESTETVKSDESKILLDGNYGQSSFKLKFLEKAGKVAKTISLANTKTKVTIHTRKKEALPGEQEIVKTPRVSANGKYVMVNLTTYERLLNREKYPHSYGGQTESTKVMMYDSHGNLLFEKAYPKYRGVPDPLARIAVSDIGISAVATENATESCDPPDCGYRPLLYVYNKNGEELLVYPNEKDKNIYPADILKISPNGKYLAVRVGFSDEVEPYLTVFFNLATKKSWKAEHSYVIYDITNDGQVECDYYDETTKAPSITTSIDIKKHLGE